MDYKKLGLKIGLEIHQQLDSHKLFCRCPSIISEGAPDIVINRMLRAVAGESGEVDIAASYEQAKEKKFIYHGYNDTVCLVELDCEPPHELNSEALETALQIALLLHAKPVDAVQVMRKTVVDGSNTSGFQRTALIAAGGFIETSLGRVGISGVCLEEEAAKIVKRSEKVDIYNLSRLGIPLVEIATGPDITTPEQAKEAAQLIGNLLRSAKVKRGLGTIRQDINMSIKGAKRVELKGFQELRSIPKVIEKEIGRQLGLLKAGKTLGGEVRKVEPDFTTSYLRPLPGAARMYPETDVPVARISDEMLRAIKLPKQKAERTAEIKKLGLGDDLANRVLRLGKQDVLVEFASKFKNVKSAFIAETLVSYSSELLREKADPSKINKAHLEKIFSALDNGGLAKESVMPALVDIGKGKELETQAYKKISDKELEAGLAQIVRENKGLNFAALMGMAMAKYRGRADGKRVSEILKKLLGQNI